MESPFFVYPLLDHPGCSGWSFSRYSQVPNNHRDHRRRRGDTSGEHGHMPGASGGKAGGMNFTSPVTTSPVSSCGFREMGGPSERDTLPKTNIAPENRPSQKETHLPTIHFQVLSFREGRLVKYGLNLARKSYSQIAGIFQQCSAWDPKLLFLSVCSTKTCHFRRGCVQD